MCIIHILQCPKCKRETPVPYICPTRELGFRKDTGPLGWYRVIFDTNCNISSCKRIKGVHHIPETDNCQDCLENNRIESCHVVRVQENCQRHLNDKQREHGQMYVFKSMFQDQINSNELRNGKPAVPGSWVHEMTKPWKHIPHHQ
jgi:hypothetical protein